MSKWEMVRLGDVCRINMGQSPESTSYNKDMNGLPFYQGNADFGTLYPVTRYWCTEPKKLARPQDILISVRAPIGALNIATETSCIGRGLAAISMIDNVSNLKYIYYVLHSRYDELNSKGTGSTFKAISKTILYDLEIPLLPLAEQQGIADELDKISDLIAKRKSQIEKLDLLVKAKFVEMFGDPVVNPMGWEIKQLDTLFNIIDGDRGANYPKQEDFLEEGHCLFLNTGNVTREGFRFDKNQFIDETKDLMLRKGKLEREDIVLTTRGTVGNLAHYAEWVRFDHIRINSGMVILRKQSPIEYFYFLHYFRNPVIYKKLISGSAQPQLPISSLRKARISLPPLPLQTQFAAYVQSVEKTKAKMEQGLAELEVLYKERMQEYFG